MAQTFGVGVSSSTPNLGNVASGASGGDTTFRINPSTGAVTKQSGAGGRVSSATTRATVTVSCGNQSACNTTQVSVRVGQAGSPTKRARALTNFTAAAGSASITVAPTGTSTINFRISAIGQNSSKTFYIGADFPIADDASALVTGQADSSFYVWVAAAPSTPTGTVSGSGTATANVFRSLSLSQTATLTFGRLVRPLSGPGWVQLAASNGGRTSSGAFWMTLPSPTRAAYTATGEGGKVLSISVPSSFTMTGPNSGSVTVTTNNNVVATPTLSSIPGNNGTYSFFVGGKLDVTDATPGGLYSGAYQVTVSYN